MKKRQFSDTKGFKFMDYIGFLWAMTEKDIKVRYKRAVFGISWVLLNPLLQMLIIGSIFSFFIKIPNYFLFLFTGLLPWIFFSQSLSEVTPSFVNERTLLQKSKFPIETLPFSIILSNFIHFLVSFFLLLVYLVFSGFLTIQGLSLVIFPLIWLLFLTVGASFLTATFHVKFRDVKFFVQALLILWFYATPIIYDLKLIPSKLLFLFALNPLTSIFELFRYSLLGSGVLEIRFLLPNLAVTFLAISIGGIIYLRHYKYFVDWL